MKCPAVAQFVGLYYLSLERPLTADEKTRAARLLADILWEVRKL